MDSIIYLHIYKTRTGYELIASASQDISKNTAIVNSWNNFETKTEAKRAAKELKNTGSYQGSLPMLGWILFHNF